jgi:prophage regulatory protein
MTANSSPRNTAEKTRVLQPFEEKSIKLAQFVTNRWVVSLPQDITLDDMENPALWTQADDIMRGDRVEVIQPLRWTELVAYNAPGRPALRVIRTVELPEQRAIASPITKKAASAQNAHKARTKRANAVRAPVFPETPEIGTLARPAAFLQTTKIERIIRRKVVQEITGWCKSGIYKAVSDRIFTPPLKIGPRASGWPESEVAAIQAARIAGKSQEEVRSLVRKLEASRAIKPDGPALSKEKVLRVAQILGKAVGK